MSVSRKILVGTALSAICLTFIPINNVYAEDDLFSTLKQNYTTQASNYGKFNEENVDPGYQAYLNNISTSSDLLVSELEDFNKYAYENVPAYENIKKQYSDAVGSQQDVSKEASEKYEETKLNAQNSLQNTENKATEEYSKFADSLSSLKNELSSSKNSITQEAQKAANTHYNNVAKGYADAVKKVNSGQIASGAYKSQATYQSEYKNAVKTLQKQYAAYKKDLTIKSEGKKETNNVKQNRYKGCISGAKKAKVSMSQKQINDYCSKESTLYQKPW